jgi:thiol-disulfide isomerase/thioredoxin
MRTSSASTRSMPLFLWILPAVSILYLGACFAVNAYLPPQNRNYVKWVDLSKAAKESEKAHKPILYDFSAAWCGPCNMMESEVFDNKKFGGEINNMFVPVHVVDRTKEDGVNPLEIDRVQKQFKIRAFPTLIVTEPDGIEFKKQEGYGGGKATEEFLRKSMMDIAASEYSMHVSWKKLDDVIDDQKNLQKPLLILCWNDRAEMSRWEYLGSPALIRTINHDFTPVEVRMPITKNSFKSTKSKELMAELALKHSPALVIVPSDKSMPHFNIGASSAAANEEFLQKYLQYRDHAPEQH